MPLTSIVNDFQILLLMSIRILVLLSFTPIISASQTPFFIRVVLAGIIAYIIKNVLGITPFETPSTLSQFVITFAGEALIGAVIGFYIQMIFMFLTSVSEFFTTLMGLRAAQVLNPLTGVQTIIVTQFISLIVMLVFISSYTLQKIFYYGIMQSFIALNTQAIFTSDTQSFLGFLFYSFSQLFERSFIIALPMFIALLIVNIGLGLFGKVAPQMNLLVLGLPLQVGMGMVFLLLFLPLFVNSIESTFDNMFHYITSFIRMMKVV